MAALLAGNGSLLAGNGSLLALLDGLERSDGSWNASAFPATASPRALNGTGNETLLARSPARQKEVDSLRIVLYGLIFLLSVGGNVLIILVLAANRCMRTVTNCFLLSLAFSDLMMAVFCVPFTLIPNLLEDFIFGAAMCKIVAYFMGISVSISTFSLVAIAIERYSAICNPLKSRSWQTRSHACRVVAVTWAVSLLVMLPYPVFSQLTPFTKTDGALGHMCRLHWPSSGAEQTWYVLLLLTLFFIPGVVMITAYGLISRELYRGIQFELNHNPETTALRNGGGDGHHDDNDGCYIQVSNEPAMAAAAAAAPCLPTVSAAGRRTRGARGARGAEPPRASAAGARWRAKRRVIRMLAVVVALFFACWTPLYAANTWRAFDLRSAQRALTGAPISFIHLLSYTSACVNPAVYCFMNTRFRSALLATCGGGGGGGAQGGGRGCCRPRRRQRFRATATGGGDDGYTSTTAGGGGGHMSRVGYSAVSTQVATP